MYIVYIAKMRFKLVFAGIDARTVWAFVFAREMSDIVVPSITYCFLAQRALKQAQSVIVCSKIILITGHFWA